MQLHRQLSIFVEGVSSWRQKEDRKDTHLKHQPLLSLFFSEEVFGKLISYAEHLKHHRHNGKESL